MRPPRDLRSLDRRLRRVWEHGLAELEAADLVELRSRAGAACVVEARALGDGPAGACELVLSDGLRVQLGACHLPTVERLDREAPALLGRADRYGPLWVMEFPAGDGGSPLSLLARRLRVARGGRSVPRPRVPAPAPAGYRAA